MAQGDTGRREVVQDPLRQQAQRGLENIQLPVGLVRSPDRPNMSGFGAEQEQLSRAMGGLNDVLNDMFEREKDTWITEGKTAYMSGVAEAELMKNGNRYTQMGYQQLKARNDVNNWYLQEQADLVDKSNSMSPQDYQAYIAEKRKAYLETVTDPYAKRVAVAAFEDLNPTLAQKQLVQNNAYNYEQQKNEARNYLRTGAQASPTSGRRIPGETSLVIQPQAVEPVMEVSERDRDLAIKTMVGEAGNEGELGLAAVAHNFRNRATDSRYPSSIGAVVLQKGQYSAWKLHGSQINALGPGNAAYDKAARVFDTVMSGRHIDPTGGALFYHSPAGMKAYSKRGVAVSDGTRRRTAAAESDPNSIRIGGHVFYGKSNRAQAAMRASIEPVEEQGDGGYVDPMVSAPNYDPTAGEKFPGKAADDLLPNTAGEGNMVDELNQAPASEGVTGIKEAGAPNETMDMLLNYKGVKPEDWVDMVSDEMALGLLTGDDSLFSNGGGIATLQKLGATADQIAKVVRANDKWQDEQDKQLDEDDAKFIDDIMRQADQPGADRDKLYKQIDERRNQPGGLTDGQARNLVDRAFTQIRSNDQRNADKERTKQAAQDEAAASPYRNREFNTELGNVYQKIKDGTYDAAKSLDVIEDMAERYNLKPDFVLELTKTMFSLDQGARDNERADLEARVKATRESEEAKTEVHSILGRGYGLDGVTGDVKITRQDGTTQKMSKKNYGIEMIKQQGLLYGSEQVMDGPKGQETVTTNVNATKVAAYVFPKLQQQGVIDPETKQQFAAALTGPIITKDDKGRPKLTTEAERAYGLYADMRRNNVLNGDFIAEQVGNDYVRAMLEQAYSLDGGNMTGTEALVRAKEMADNTEIDPTYKGRTDRELDKALEGQGEEFVRQRLAGSWGDWLATDGDQVDRATVVDGRQMQEALRTRALRYRDAYPWQTPEAAINLAKQDLERDTSRIAGNLVISPDKIHTFAGLQRPEDLDRAIGDYIMDHSDDFFPTGENEWKTRGMYTGVGSLLTGPDRPYGATNPPPVKLIWMSGMQQFLAYRITDPETGEVDLGHRVLIDPKTVGDAWKQKKTAHGLFSKLRENFDKNIVQEWKKDEPSAIGTGAKNLFEAIQNSTKDFRDNLQETERSLGQQSHGRPAY